MDVLERAWELVRAERRGRHRPADHRRRRGVRHPEAPRRAGRGSAGRSWRPLPARRVFIPKPGREERRPLSIPAVRDRVVQAAVKIVIEPIFGKRRTTGMREGNGRVLHRRPSESRWPRVMRWRPARAQRSVDRGARRPAIEPRNGALPGCRRGRRSRKATPLAAFSRAVSGPRGVGEPVHVCDLSMLRTGRSHGHPPVVMEGRVVRGRPRP